MNRLISKTSILLFSVVSTAVVPHAGCSRSKSSKSTQPANQAAPRGQTNAPAATPVERSPRPRGDIAGAQAAGSPSVSSKRAVFIIAPTNFRDEELAEPRAILTKAGYTVSVACSAKGPVKGMLGTQVKPDLLLSQIKVDDYRVVVFVGGSGAKAYFEASAAHRIAKEAFLKGKVLGAICLAPAILAKAGVLKGKKATVYPAANSLLKAGGALLQEEPVVVDGRLVTANGPKAAGRFGQALVKVASGLAGPN